MAGSIGARHAGRRHEAGAHLSHHASPTSSRRRDGGRIERVERDRNRAARLHLLRVTGDAVRLQERSRIVAGGTCRGHRDRPQCEQAQKYDGGGYESDEDGTHQMDNLWLRARVVNYQFRTSCCRISAPPSGCDQDGRGLEFRPSAAPDVLTHDRARSAGSSRSGSFVYATRIIPSHQMTLFGPRITIFTKDGKSYTIAACRDLDRQPSAAMLVQLTIQP